MFIRQSKSFCLTKAEASALLAHASTDETRPHLHSVGFFPSKGTAVATDGTRLAALASKDGEVADGANFILPRFPLATAAKACPTKGLISIVNGQIDVYEDAETLPIDGMSIATLPFVGPTDPYPPWEDVIPPMHKATTAPSIAFNADYLATLATVAKACEGPECVMHIPASAIEASLFCLGEWRVVIMPRRNEETEKDSAAVVGAAIMASVGGGCEAEGAR